MAEPHSTAATATGGVLIASSITAMGPVLGPYLVIALFAFGGAFVSLTIKPPTSTSRGLAILARAMVVAMVATGMLAWGLSAAVPGLGAHDWIGPLAFLIGLQPEWALQRLRRLTGDTTTPEGDGK